MNAGLFEEEPQAEGDLKSSNVFRSQLYKYTTADSRNNSENINISAADESTSLGFS